MRVSGPWALAAVLLVTGCDSFSVIEQFSYAAVSSAPTLTLAAQTPTLQQNETTLLVPSGGVPPYNYNVLVVDRFYAGTLGTVDAGTPEYTAGTSIGTLKIRVIDSHGATADTVVTILPPSPTGFNVVFTTSPKKGTLSWTYPDKNFISGYELWCSTNSGVSYSSLGTLSRDDISYTQNGADSNYYKLYAISGAYQSLPVEAH